MCLPISTSSCGVGSILSCVGGLQSQWSLLNRLAYFYFLQQTRPKKSECTRVSCFRLTFTKKKKLHQPSLICRNEEPLCALRITVVSAGSLTQLCSDVESLSGL